MCFEKASVTNLIDKLIVIPNAIDPQCGQLQIGDHLVPCMLGRSGVYENKQEGDGATPAGEFPLRRVLYRADRIAAPKSTLATTIIGESDGWCDEPNDPCYNLAVKLPYSASTEEMWREDHRYDVVVVIGYNDHPVVPGVGSAIFMHLTEDDGGPTAGCIAVSLPDMLEILKVIGPNSVVEIRVKAT